MPDSRLSRRDFARIFAAGGSVALFAHPALAQARPHGAATAAGSSSPSLRGALGDVDWKAVRSAFRMPPELSVMNAANLCPSPAHVLDSVTADTERLDRDPVPSYRREMHGVREPARDLIAQFLGVNPEDVLITRNTSEANNWVSAGLDLGKGDEVVIVADNHPSNNQAWRARSERFGFVVREIEPPSPHPGADYYVEAFRGAMTQATRLIAFTHITNTAGDLFPASDLCELATERGVMTLVDGAQSFGLMNVNLRELGADFYTGSAHKWTCGPKEAGILYVSPRVQDRLWPSIYSAYAGERGLSRTHEGMGQRDEPALRAFGRQVAFLSEIGMTEIEARSRSLANALYDGLSGLAGVHMWTSPQPERRAAVVTFRPGELDPAKVLSALESDGIVAASRTGEDRPGIRFSPHFYNSENDLERAVQAISHYLRTGL